MKTSKAVNLFLESRRAKNLSPKTILWYRGILMDFSVHFLTVPNKPEKIDRYMAGLNSGDERRHGYYRALRCFYRFMEKRYQVTNPFMVIEPPKVSRKVPRTLTPEEINRVLGMSNGEIKAAIMFLIDTGARLSEYISVIIENLHETEEGFTCVINGKTGEREIPISYETYHALMITPRWTKSSWWLSRLIARNIRAAGINATAHNLRHTFGTIWRGEDDLVLQQIMGHSNLSTTKKYRHLRIENLQQQHHKYSPLRMVLSASKNML